MDPRNDEPELRVVPTAGVSGRRAYGVPRAPGEIDLFLDGNEGLTPPRELMEALASAWPGAARRYPGASRLTEVLAGRLGVGAERVLVTAGGDDAIDRACRAVLSPGRELLATTPTFEMFSRYAELAGAGVAEVEWLRGEFPTEGVLAGANDRTAAVAVVSPNNPTGLTCAATEIVRIARALPRSLIIADLAYAEFDDEDATPRLVAEPNIVIIRTLSKAWGLAGLRVGYAVGDERVIGWLRVAGGPYTVSGPALAMAEAAVATCGFQTQAFIARVKWERAALWRVLSGVAAEVWPSKGNFVLARFADAASVHRRLSERGIAVRAFPGKPRLGDCLRITCPGEPAAFDRLCDEIVRACRPEEVRA